MQQEFKMARGWAVFVWITIPILMIAFGLMGILPYFEEEISVTEVSILTPLSLGLEFLLVLGLMDMVKSRLIVEKDKIISVGVFKTRTLALSQIKGFRENKHYLFLIPVNSNEKKIKISEYIGKRRQLQEWVYQNFNNLDKEELLRDEKEILNNDEFGVNAEERELCLKKARNLAKVLNAASLTAGVSFWFYPQFYKIQVLLCAALPILGFIVYRRFNGLIKLGDKPNSAHPNLFLTMLIPSCILMIRALTDFSVFNYDNFWKPALAILVVFGFLVVNDKNITYNFKKGITYVSILGMLVFVAMYAYGSIITSNAVFDQSQPKTYKAKVLNKRISSGKTTTYYLQLGQWGPQQEVDEVPVSRGIYENKAIGDSAIVYFNHGFYKIPYYLVIE